MRVLVVEDDAELADVLRRGLEAHALAVDLAVDGAQALEKADLTAYEVIVLDRDLPVVHGDDVCRRLVDAGTPARILMLTAAGRTADLVDGLSLGADDYIGKPFAMSELVARVRALGRRSGTSRPVVLTYGQIEVDVARRVARRGADQLSLTRKEFGVLEVLTAAAGAVVSAEDLLEQVWDENADPFTNAVRVTMVTLRRKLGDPPVIETVTGSGYRLTGVEEVR
jgi:DNA-binding response OmpR family regulator